MKSTCMQHDRVLEAVNVICKMLQGMSKTKKKKKVHKKKKYGNLHAEELCEKSGKLQYLPPSTVWKISHFQ